MFNLEPVPNAVNLTPGEFVFDKPITLCIKENFLSFHGGDFAIVDVATGEQMFKVRGPPITFHDKKTFSSADGKKLFLVRYYHDGSHQFAAERVDLIDPTVMYTDPHLPIFDLTDVKGTQDGTTMRAQIWVPHADKHRSTRGMQLGLKGEFDNEGGAPIIDVATGKTVAVIHRDCDDGFAGVLLNLVPESYFITIAPGMDVAVMAGIAVCFDELHNHLHKHTHMRSASGTSLPASGKSSAAPSGRSTPAPPPTASTAKV